MSSRYGAAAGLSLLPVGLSALHLHMEVCIVTTRPSCPHVFYPSVSHLSGFVWPAVCPVCVLFIFHVYLCADPASRPDSRCLSHVMVMLGAPLFDYLHFAGLLWNLLPAGPPAASQPLGLIRKLSVKKEGSVSHRKAIYLAMPPFSINQSVNQL